MSTHHNSKTRLIEWQHSLGADENMEHTPQNRLMKKEAVPAQKIEIIAPEQPITKQPTREEPAMPRASAAKSPLMGSPLEAARQARELSDRASTLRELEEAVRNFDGCSLKKTATNTVFCDGNPESKLMLIGEAPGANEDAEGIPFCGQSGKLLDNMLLSIGITRQTCYITNTLFWRPPGNRRPTPEELDICRPFVEKHIALINPEVLLLVGGTAVAAMLGNQKSVSGLRKKVFDYSNMYVKKPIPTIITFHPSYLLRQPSQKKLAWHDMLFIEGHLSKK